MVPLWVSAASLNLAYWSRACETPFSANARICSGTSNGITEAEKGSVLAMACILRNGVKQCDPLRARKRNMPGTSTWITQWECPSSDNRHMRPHNGNFVHCNEMRQNFWCSAAFLLKSRAFAQFAPLREGLRPSG